LTNEPYTVNFSAAFMPVIDYGDMLYTSATTQLLSSWICCIIVHLGL